MTPAPTLEARAREMADLIVLNPTGSGNVKMLRDALQKARNEGLEMGAKYADEMTINGKRDSNLDFCAIGIRALKKETV